MTFPIDPKISNYELNKLFFIKNKDLNNNNNFTYDDSDFGAYPYNNRCLNYVNKEKSTRSLIVNVENLLYKQGLNRLRFKRDLPSDVVARKILRVAQYYNIKGIKSKTWYEIIQIIKYKSGWIIDYEYTNKSVSLKEFMEINALKEIDELMAFLFEEKNDINLNYNFTKNKL